MPLNIKYGGGQHDESLERDLDKVEVKIDDREETESFKSSKTFGKPPKAKKVKQQVIRYNSTIKTRNKNNSLLLPQYNTTSINTGIHHNRPTVLTEL